MELVIQLIFAAITALIIGAAMMTVLVRNIIHAALWLIASFFGVAALYLLLEAEFIAVVQVLIYVGAVSILILFAIMLTRQITNQGAQQFVARWWVGAVVAVTLFTLVMAPALITATWVLPPQQGPAGAPAVLAGPAELGRGFVSEFLLQFEIAGLLLLVALIGAIVIAFEERARRRRVLTLAEEHALRSQESGVRSQNEPPQPLVAAERTERATAGQD
ncbi:NADH-quinone oxidoreductase subunit J [Candidatus Gracilibacteria bacterium]|nr:NADH-quinone oxidoreductase subunit J [Candidatus Gracilibacteria bacterium]